MQYFLRIKFNNINQLYNLWGRYRTLIIIFPILVGMALHKIILRFVLSVVSTVIKNILKNIILNYIIKLNFLLISAHFKKTKHKIKKKT